MREKITTLVKSNAFQRFILALIVVNAITIGVETSIQSEGWLKAFVIFDAFCLSIYCIEIALKLIAFRGAYFKDPWNVFDFVIVAICLIPVGIIPFPPQVVRIFRIFRVFRVFRLVSAFKQMRVIVEAMGRSLPGVFWTALLLIIVYYVFAVIGTVLFGQEFPDWFGDIGKSFYTLFQVMTLESWSMGISRPVMEVFPYAWIYFVPFVIASAFIIVNVVVGIIVGTIDEANARVRRDESKERGDTLQIEFDKLKEQLQKVETLLDERE